MHDTSTQLLPELSHCWQQRLGLQVCPYRPQLAVPHSVTGQAVPPGLAVTSSVHSRWIVPPYMSQNESGSNTTVTVHVSPPPDSESPTHVPPVTVKFASSVRGRLRTPLASPPVLVTVKLAAADVVPESTVP